MSLADHQDDWENLGEIDPLWAVLSEKEKRHGKWDIEAFFQTGVEEIRTLLKKTENLGLPGKKERALDFGCGVGRLSRALAGSFGEVVGVDISAPMLEKARQFCGDTQGIRFVLNTSDDLSQFGDGEFDLIYSNIVLQHVPSEAAIRSYIREFVRLLSPGGVAVFQLPSRRNWKVRLNPRRRLYKVLRAVGFSPRYLIESLDLSPIHMSALSEDDIRREVKAAGGTIPHVESASAGGPNVQSRLYFVTRV